MTVCPLGVEMWKKCPMMAVIWRPKTLALYPGI